MADPFLGKKIYRKSALVGGTDECLDSIDGDVVQVNDMCMVHVNVGTAEAPEYVTIWFIARNSAADAVAGDIVLPVANPGDMRWHVCQRGVYYGTSQPPGLVDGMIFELMQG